MKRIELWLWVLVLSPILIPAAVVGIVWRLFEGAFAGGYDLADEVLTLAFKRSIR